MATSRLISPHLRRRTPLSLLNHISPPSPTSTSSHAAVSPSPSTASFRFFSSHSPDPDFTRDTNSVFNHDMNLVTESELRNLGLFDGADEASAAVAAAATNVSIEDSIFPIRAIVSFLDGYHELTGLPWWIVIASSTVALRFALLPLVILQRKKLKQIGETLPKLPLPLPPPFSSGKSFWIQLALFRLERQAHGCPSFFWFIASQAVMMPCFILLMGSIRTMALNKYPGFDTGGILWLQDLTVSGDGFLGCTVPLLIGCLHLCNIQISFRGSSIDKGTGVFQLLAKWYRKYLQLLTLPILLGALNVPQGCLFYWVTNSSLNLIQQLSLQHPVISQKLGIPCKGDLRASGEFVKDINVVEDTPSKKRAVSVFDYSPRELVHLSVLYLSTGKKDKAFQLLSLAVEKDPDCYRAWTVFGNLMMEKGLFNKASEYAENAISTIPPLEEPYDIEAVDFLIQAYTLACGALYKQGKLAEAIAYFERLSDMKEPEDQVAKCRYYEGLVVFASILHNAGRTDEAARHLLQAVAFDPRYTEILKNLEVPKDATDDFVDDLASSRRAEY